MHAVFVACLFGGGLATALFAILGRVGGHIGHGGHGHLHVPGHAHAHGPGGHALHGHGPAPGAGHAHAGAHGSHGHDGPARAHLPAQQHTQAAPQTPRAMQTSGGTGHGWLASSAGWTLSWLSPLTLAAAALWFGAVGLIAEGPAGSVALLVAIVAAVVGGALVRNLMGAFVRASTPPLQLTGEGAIATVNATIKPDAPGEVIYTLEGLHRSSPARSEDGSTIPRGTTVVIVRREGGFAWVTSIDPLSELEADAPVPLPQGRPEEDMAVSTSKQVPDREAVDSGG